MSKPETKKFLTLDEVVNPDHAVDLEVEELGIWIKVKSLSTGDRIEAERLAMSHPKWEIMGQDDKDLELSKMLALQMLVEPKISYNDYLTANDVTMQLLFKAMTNYHVAKMAVLTEKNRTEVKRFLEVMKANNLLSSSIYSELMDSIGEEQEESS